MAEIDAAQLATDCLSFWPELHDTLMQCWREERAHELFGLDHEELGGES